MRNNRPNGVPTRTMLVTALIPVITSVTFSSLLVVRSRVQHQVLAEFCGDLKRSAGIFGASEAQRLAALRRVNALLAEPPSLKALMTTAETTTITDGAARFWQISDSDFFALADSDGHLVTVYTRGAPPGEELEEALPRVLGVDDRRFLVADDRLFEYSVQPLSFGNAETGTLLGYVITGYVVDSALVHESTRAPPRRSPSSPAGASSPVRAPQPSGANSLPSAPG